MSSESFEALGLTDEATPTQVRAAWRLKVARAGVHPDMGGDVNTFEKLRAHYERALKIAENAPCTFCRGTGSVDVAGSGFARALLRCTACNGTGKRH